MKRSTLTSRADSLVCPICETGQLLSSTHDTMSCQSCGSHLSGEVLEALRQIITLPDTLGSHPCECGHPEMRHLPDETFHCPACGSEVLPVDVPSSPSDSMDDGLPYWSGWVDGRFGERSSFVDNPNLAKWESPSDRLDYYRGHRAGSELRGLASRLAPVLPRRKG